MKTITRISGVDCKIGRNSRTGSTISMTIDDQDIIDVVAYFNDVKANKKPTGKIKKIELNLYYDQQEIIDLPDTKELDSILGNEDLGYSHQPSLGIFDK